MEAKRQLAAIIFTDIAGFTKLSAKDESLAFQILEQQRQLLQPIVENHGGDWLKEMGDGLLLSFSSTLKAVQCAMEMQKTTAAIEHLNIRIGIHQGDIIIKGSDIFGDGVNTTSRIEPLAPVGGIAVSQRIQEDISSYPEFATVSMGYPLLKGVDRAMEIFCVVGKGLPTPTKTWSKKPPSDGAEQIGEYELVREIGRGSYGEIWLARGVTGIYRALKIIRKERFEDEQPFEREFAGIQQYEQLSKGQEGLMDLYHVGRDDQVGHFYYVMELADDRKRPSSVDPDHYKPKTLTSELYARERLSTEECLGAGITLARGLAHLHHFGFVHRDVKPANIIFVQGRPKLADVGLVNVADSAGPAVGTHGYLPPEGAGQPAADIFGLGMVLYEMLTGYDRTQYPSFPEVSVDSPNAIKFNGLCDVVRIACADSPQQRYPDANALADALESVIRLSEPSVIQVTIEKEGHRWGPYTKEQAREYLQSGAFAFGDKAWHEGLPDWLALGKLLGESEIGSPPPSTIVTPEEKPDPEVIGSGGKNRILTYGIAATGVALLVAGGIFFMGKGGDEANPSGERPDDKTAEEKSSPPSPFVVGGTILGKDIQGQQFGSGGKYQINPDGTIIGHADSYGHPQTLVFGPDVAEGEIHAEITHGPLTGPNHVGVAMCASRKFSWEAADRPEWGKIHYHGSPCLTLLCFSDSIVLTDKMPFITAGIHSYRSPLFSMPMPTGKTKTKLGLVATTSGNGRKVKVYIDDKLVKEITVPGNFMGKFALITGHSTRTFSNVVAKWPNSNPSDTGSATDPLSQAISANSGDLKKALIQIARKGPGHFMQDSKGNINFLSIGDREIPAESLSLLKGPAVEHITLLNIGKNFSQGKIIDLELKYLKQLPRLKKLYLGHNISDVGLTYLAAEFPHLVNLQFYYRKGVGPTNKGLIQLKAFDRLDALKLGYFDFTNPDVLEFLSSMPLKLLDFRESKLTDATILKVAALKPNLRRLEIRLDKKQPGQGLTDQALQYLQNIKSLEELNIENYQFSKPALDQLQKALPECKIEVR